MRLHDNDRWTAIFTPPSPGRYLDAIEAWTDLFLRIDAHRSVRYRLRDEWGDLHLCQCLVHAQARRHRHHR
jgi:hypothetical protein